MQKKGMYKILIPIAALLLCGLIVLLERNGVTLDYINVGSSDVEFTQDIEQDTECLIIYVDEDEISNEVKDMMSVVLGSMKIGHDILEAGSFSEKYLKNYKTVVLALEDWDVLGESIFDICDWVKSGGNMMAAITPQPNMVFNAVALKLGIENGGTDYAAIKGLRILNECMIGAKEQDVYSLGEEPLEVSINVSLDNDSEVYVESDDGAVPIIWKTYYGDGEFVVINEAILSKFHRGFLCMAYTLFDEVSIYPVINASTFYLDDFPSPTPSGDAEYIERDYGIDVGSFYSTIWWPRVFAIGNKHDVKYSGFIIEEYSDQVEAPFDRNMFASQFVTFGNMLLNNGGELGFHGYNHMPLCIEGIDDDRLFGDYELWKSAEDIKAAVTELYEFSSDLFPKATFSVYVPPSNIISEAGIDALTEACPDIKVIAGTYLPDTESKVYEQEFGVDERGIIHTPRVTSGCLLGYYDYLNVFSELNFHFVQSHFMHPDDTLDVDRGAELGWEQLSSNFEQYMDYIYKSAPAIRNLTASEMGTAVLKYDKVSIDREYDEENKVLTVKLGGFSDEVYFLMRVNEGSLKKTDNCEAEHVTGNLYLVHATEDIINIHLGE